MDPAVVITNGYATSFVYLMTSGAMQTVGNDYLKQHMDGDGNRWKKVKCTQKDSSASIWAWVKHPFNRLIDCIPRNIAKTLAPGWGAKTKELYHHI